MKVRPPRSTVSPFYALVSDGGNFYAEVIAGPTDNVDLESLPPGVMDFEFVTIDGRRSHGDIKLSSGETGASRFHDLEACLPRLYDVEVPPDAAGQNVLVGLWTSREAPGGAPIYERIAVDAWGNAAKVEGGRVSLPDLPDVYAVQMISNGVSIMSRLPARRAFLDVQWGHAGRKADTSAPIPRVESDGDWTWIYGCFLVSGAADAARALGRKLQKQIGTGASPDRLGRIARGQWAVRVGSRHADIAGIRRMLREGWHETDEVALDWLLHDDFPSSDASAGTSPSLPDVVRRICKSPPLFTETLALVSERIEPALERWAAKNPSDQLDEYWRTRFHRLISATLWNLPLLTYRADRPDMEEIAAEPESGIAAKKKSDFLEWTDSPTGLIHRA